MVVRIILTLALIVLSYRETGIFTALSLFFIFLGLELQGFLTKRALDDVPPQEAGDLTPADVHEKMAQLPKPRRQ